MTIKVNLMTDHVPPDSLTSQIQDTVTRRIAAGRREAGLSLDELASRSGVSKGTLVQIEQGRANPSLSTLCRLAVGLGVSVTDLVDTSDTPQQPIRVVPANDMKRLWAGPNGGSATLVAGSEGPDMLELWKWVLHPGERFEAPPHSPGTLELIHVQQGSLRLEMNGTDQILVTGSAAIAHTDAAHAYICHGARRTEFTMVVLEPAATRSHLNPRPGGR
jgi:transcriptional regulator with XRE-family HTH domain